MLCSNQKLQSISPSDDEVYVSKYLSTHLFNKLPALALESAVAGAGSSLQQAL